MTQDRGGVTINGAVLPALRLSVAGRTFGGEAAGSVRATVEAAGPDFVQINLMGDGQTQSLPITIPLEIRTNSGYKLGIALLSANGCVPQVRTSINSIRESGDLVVASAASNSRSFGAIDLAQPNHSGIVLAGPRVSARGNFTSARNALLADLKLGFLAVGPPQCPWQATLRLSLEPSTSF